MLQSPDLQSKIAHWRAKADAGQMTAEDWSECYAALRADRRGALQAASQSGKRPRAAKAAKAPVDLAALKSSLRSLGSPPKPETQAPPVGSTTAAISVPAASSSPASVGGPPRLGPPKI